MGKRSRVISASGLLIVGGALMAISFLGGSPTVNAAAFGQSSVDFSRLLLWGGAVALFISAVLFISASSE